MASSWRQRQLLPVEIIQRKVLVTKKFRQKLIRTIVVAQMAIILKIKITKVVVENAGIQNVVALLHVIVQFQLMD
ncbi:hypothetical protein [Flavobacterium sp. ZS1P14]|uniref:hypothetical protein n=1 Tax=Flavobacterium sp. ZS1P14 TaxID=3401729 RepID=UPI003AB0858C